MTNFPDVPDLPGVPPLPRNPNAQATPPVAQLTSDQVKSPDNKSSTWGIFTASGAAALVVDSIIGVGFDGEFEISTYPQEEGAFESYNKVERPFVVNVRATRGGSDANITAFVNALDAMRKSLDLFTISTPQYSHENVNITKVSYNRTAERGVNLMTADIVGMQVRETVTQTFSVTAQPAGADVVDSGAVQPQPPTDQQSKGIDAFGTPPVGKVGP